MPPAVFPHPSEEEAGPHTGIMSRITKVTEKRPDRGPKHAGHFPGGAVLCAGGQKQSKQQKGQASAFAGALLRSAGKPKKRRAAEGSPAP